MSQKPAFVAFHFRHGFPFRVDVQICQPSFFVLRNLGGRWRPTEIRILRLLSDGEPHSHRQIVKQTGLEDGQVWASPIARRR